MKKLLSMLTVLCLLTVCLFTTGCDGNTKNTTNTDNSPKVTSTDKPSDKTTPTETSVPTETEIKDGEPYKLAFKETVSYELLKKLDGKAVKINGYLATSSPANGSFIFLMNLPYQSCPFCVPNTSQLANTIEVYPKSGDKFEYTTQAVSVVGTLKCAEDGKNFTDEFGYEFNYKIVDAEYKIMTEEDMTDTSLKGYQKIADSGLMMDLYNMYDYVWFIIDWYDYMQDPYTDLDGVEYPGYYMYPGDMQGYIDSVCTYVTPTYFEDLVTKVEGLNENGSLDTLIQNIKDCKELCAKAFKGIENEEWTTETRYFEELKGEETKFTMNDGQKWQDEYNGYWDNFIQYIYSFEL